MNRISFLIIAFLMLNIYTANSQDGDDLVDQCVASAGSDVTYLKDFKISLPEATDKQHPPILKKSIILRKNTTYRFTICNNEDSEDEGVLKLFDTNKMIVSSYNPKTGKTYQSINFQCSKTGPYTIFFYFKNGKSGNAIGILSYVERK